MPVAGSGGSFASADCRADASSDPHVGKGGAAGGEAAGGGAVTVTVTGVATGEPHAVISASTDPHRVSLRFRLTAVPVRRTRLPTVCHRGHISWASMALHLHRAERTDLLADGLGALLATPLPD